MARSRLGARAPRYATEALRAVPASGSSARRDKAAILSFVLDGVHTARHRHHPRRRGGGDPGRAPLRPAGDGAVRRPATARASLALYKPAPTSTGWSPPSAGCTRCSADVRPARPLPGVIIDHSKRPRNCRALAAPTTPPAAQPAVRRPPPLQLELDGDRIAQIGFQGQGCAISTASASVMTETVLARR